MGNKNQGLGGSPPPARTRGAVYAAQAPHLSDKPMDSDLQVARLSDALTGVRLDFIVSGSIAAVESIRLIRMLRRLGAEVTPWLTQGGSQFVTPLALAWAAARPVRTAFEGEASHIAQGDGCIVAPASASFLGGLAQGLLHTPALALAASYLGQNKPVMLLPTMHGSLKASPAVVHNMDKLRSFGVQWLAPRQDEGKDKFPDPESTADVIGHFFNRTKREGASVFVTMGTTRGFIDEVRYVSNYSSGKLGTLIAEELFRQGYQTEVISGPCPHQPKSATHLTQVMTNAEMEAAVRQAVRGGAQAGVFAASVLDFIPEKAAVGKLSSQDYPTLDVHLRRAEKIIGGVHLPLKIGFKLEVGLHPDRIREIAQTYIQRYGLSMMVVNDLKDVDDQRHRAVVFEVEKHMESREISRGQEVYGKMDLAQRIVGHISHHLEQQSLPMGTA